MSKNKNKNLKSKIDVSKKIRGIARAEHFSSGGTPSMWTPPKMVQTSRAEKRKKNRGENRRRNVGDYSDDF